MAAGWFRERRGTALAVLVAALTVGQAFPHLLASVTGPDSWRVQMLVTAALAVAGGLLVLVFVREGPHAVPAETFDPHAAAHVYRNPHTRYAVFGYLGHQWELYTMWTWIGTFAAASLAEYRPGGRDPGGGGGGIRRGGGRSRGMPGRRTGGRSARQDARRGDRAAGVGRLCGPPALVYGSHPALLYLFIAAWGTAVVADSAQFSALVADNSRPEYVGTALTVETCSGYLLTMLTIRVIPSLADASAGAGRSWRWSRARCSGCGR